MLPLQDPDFNHFGFISRNGIARSYGAFILNFMRTIHIVFHSNHTILHFHQQCARAPVFPHPRQQQLLPFGLLCLFVFYESHPNRYQVISHHSFDLHFSDNQWCWIHIPIPVGHLYVIFGKIPSQVLCPYFNLIVFWLSCISFFYILDTNPLSNRHFADTFSRSTGGLFFLLMLHCLPKCFSLM